MNGWKKKRLGEVAELIMGQSPDSKYYSSDDIGMPFLQGCAEFSNRSPVAKQYCSQPKKIGKKYSILFSVRAPVGRINVADRDYIIGRGLAAINGKEVVQSYLEQYFKFSETGFKNASQGSTFEAINSSELSNWEILFPSHAPEQTLIAEILSTVDRTIEQTEALIAKQQRIKTGLMQDLLTKGIDAHGNIRSEATHAFKDSPLGRIPVEWEVSDIGSHSNFITSGSRGWAKYYSEEGSLFIRIGNLTREHISFRMNDMVFVKPPTSSEGRRTCVLEGDLLISITADLGIIAVVPPEFGEAYINQHIALIRFKKNRIFPRWAGHYLSGEAGSYQFKTLNDAGAKAGLNLPTVASLLIAIPDKEEQKLISSIIDQCDDTISLRVKEKRNLLRQKTGLMQDLLIGRVRVTELLKKREVEAVI